MFRHQLLELQNLHLKTYVIFSSGHLHEAPLQDCRPLKSWHLRAGVTKAVASMRAVSLLLPRVPAVSAGLPSSPGVGPQGTGHLFSLSS